MQIRIAVIGSRSFNEYETMKRVLDHQLQGGGKPVLVSGGAIGADTLARQYAKENGIYIKEHLPDDSHGYPAALFIRNRNIVDDCDVVYAFWDLESNGTLHAMKYAMKQKKPVFVFNTRYDYKPMAFAKILGESSLEQFLE